MVTVRGPTGSFKLDLAWTSGERSRTDNLAYLQEKYGGLEMTRTSDLFRVKEAQPLNALPDTL